MKKTYRVKMRDGVHLATDVYLPDAGGNAVDGCWPVVIERTPYNKSAQSRSEVSLKGERITREAMAQAFNQQGFVLIFQDCRGRYDSEGTFSKYTAEGNDGVDTLTWILENPWCNGNIGSMGLSYAAHTQLAMACLNPPGLKTMVLDSGGFASAYHCGIRQGGAFELKQATWAFKQAKLSPQAKVSQHISAALDQEDIFAWFTQMPWFVGHSPLRHVAEYENYLFSLWSKGEYGDYWQQPGLCAEHFYSQLPDIPVLFMSSWYDAYVSSTLKNFQAFCQQKKQPQRLIMGPWLHGDRNITHSGDVEFGAGAAFDGNVADSWLQCRLDWFSRWLTPQPAVRQQRQQVQVFIMGGGDGRRSSEGKMRHGGHWISSSHWPLANSQTLSLYLGEDGHLQGQPAQITGKRQYQANPHHPVPTIGGAVTSGLPVFRGGAFDQRENAEFFASRGDNLPLSARADILVFQTSPLEHDLLVAGSLKVQLWISSDAPDTDFTAKLIDVYPANEDYPQGYAMNITDGIIRCRYRNSWQKSEMLTPGVIVLVEIEPFACCNLFAKGHRLRLDIASSNFPRFDCNPNSGEPEGEARLKRIATNTLYMGQDYPSQLILTVNHEIVSRQS